jgi:hypothetical protein
MSKSSFTMRMDDELRDDLQAAADEDRRSLANLIEIVLVDWLEARKRRQGKRPTFGGAGPIDFPH